LTSQEIVTPWPFLGYWDGSRVEILLGPKSTFCGGFIEGGVAGKQVARFRGISLRLSSSVSDEKLDCASSSSISSSTCFLESLDAFAFLFDIIFASD
jgi:hypothetical protein